MEKLILFFVLFSLSFFGCQSSSNQEQIGSLENQYQECLGLMKWTQEYLDIDSMKVSGDNIPLKSSIKNLLTTLGQPDTVIPTYIYWGNSTFNDLNIRTLYFRNFEYITYENDAHIRSINFENTGIRVFYPKIILDGNTTIMDVQKAFPQSGKLARGMGSTFTGYMQLHTSKNWADVSLWFLIFKNTKLIRIDFIDPRYLNK